MAIKSKKEIENFIKNHKKDLAIKSVEEKELSVYYTYFIGGDLYRVKYSRTNSNYDKIESIDLIIPLS